MRYRACDLCELTAKWLVRENLDALPYYFCDDHYDHDYYQGTPLRDEIHIIVKQDWCKEKGIPVEAFSSAEAAERRRAELQSVSKYMIDPDFEVFTLEVKR